MVILDVGERNSVAGFGRLSAKNALNSLIERVFANLRQKLCNLCVLLKLPQKSCFCAFLQIPGSIVLDILECSAFKAK